MTSDNAQKVHFVLAMNNFATQKVLDGLNLLGKALPASVTAVQGSLVTVKFEVNAGVQQLPSVTVPKAESQWLRSPTQIGDLGMVMPSDAYLGGMSGLGGGVADLTTPSNLGALVWVPVANVSWTMDDAGKALINGPTGVIIRDQNGKTVMTLDATNGITITLPSGKALSITGDLAVTGKIFAGESGSDQVALQTHLHSGVQAGSGESGPPVAGT